MMNTLPEEIEKGTTLEAFQDLFLKNDSSQGQNLAVTVSSVPDTLGSGNLKHTRGDGGGCVQGGGEEGEEHHSGVGHPRGLALRARREHLERFWPESGRDCIICAVWDRICPCLSYKAIIWP